jgi:hypothetical protein
MNDEDMLNLMSGKLNPQNVSVFFPNSDKNIVLNI